MRSTKRERGSTARFAVHKVQKVIEGVVKAWFFVLMAHILLISLIVVFKLWKLILNGKFTF